MLDLESLLEKSHAGQWSVADFDWETPFPPGLPISERKRQLLGRVLLFTAGVERLGAYAFQINARNSMHPTVRELFEVIAKDEFRHAEAETLLARRLGVEWKDLPWLMRRAFKVLSHDLRKLKGVRGRLFHEIVGTQIVLFELGLDSLWSPTVREMIDDPFQNEIIRMIDRDESRHLAMDYWLLEQKGTGTDRTSLNARRILANLPLRLSSAALGAGAFLTFFWSVRNLEISPERFDDYWTRVQAIVDKSPHARRFPPHRTTVGLIDALVNFFDGNKAAFKGFMLLVTGRNI
ncbi:MAG: ferritin-like domain-containing protein [Chrysiogenetes bacterium]|nr:ferritin-like domain-containing protein [Chrysiogenetes bacterium]